MRQRPGRALCGSFLDKLKTSDPDDFALLSAGLAKLRDRQNHREPLAKPLDDGLFELRHVGKLNTRILWFFVRGRRMLRCMPFAIKVELSRPAISRLRGTGCITGRKEKNNEENEFRSLP